MSNITLFCQSCLHTKFEANSDHGTCIVSTWALLSLSKKRLLLKSYHPRLGTWGWTGRCGESFRACRVITPLVYVFTGQQKSLKRVIFSHVPQALCEECEECEGDPKHQNRLPEDFSRLKSCPNLPSQQQITGESYPNPRLVVEPVRSERLKYDLLIRPQ